MGRHESPFEVPSLPAGKQPQPVLSAATVSTVAHLVVLIGGWLGFSLNATSLNNWAVTAISLGIGVFTVVTHVITALKARSAVTPVASPRSAGGSQLFPLSVTDLLMRLPLLEQKADNILREVFSLRHEQLTAGTVAQVGQSILSDFGSLLDETLAPDASGADLIDPSPSPDGPPAAFDTSTQGNAHAGRVKEPAAPPTAT